uniref:glycosyltransferase family 2 protein n=1 Tax=Algoriphagus sp. TaxID=1872435 RepID=UPI004047DC13
MHCPRLAIIIPTFNRIDETRRIIQQLLNQDFIDYKILICDSGSIDGTERLDEEYPGLKILHVGSDKWWTGAINVGIQYATNLGCVLILILNDDLLIPNDLGVRLHEYSEKYPDTIITTVQKELSGLIYAGSKFNGIFKERENIRKIPSGVVQVDCSNGCCFLIPISILTAIGNTDESKIPHVGGDLNIYLKARNLGYKCIVVPDLLIKHTSYTDYGNKFTVRTLLSHPGSAMHFKTYLYLGNSLYNSWLFFIFLGIKNHYIYLKTLIKILLQLAIARKF